MVWKALARDSSRYMVVLQTVATKVSIRANKGALVSLGLEAADKHRRDEIARCFAGDHARGSGACLRGSFVLPGDLG